MDFDNKTGTSSDRYRQVVRTEGFKKVWRALEKKVLISHEDVIGGESKDSLIADSYN